MTYTRPATRLTGCGAVMAPPFSSKETDMGKQTNLGPEGSVR